MFASTYSCLILFIVNLLNESQNDSFDLSEFGLTSGAPSQLPSGVQVTKINENNVIDLSCIEGEPPHKSRRKQEFEQPVEMLDLTIDSPGPTKKTTESSETVIATTRLRRGRKSNDNLKAKQKPAKAPKVKKLGYKQALALLKAPQADTTPVPECRPTPVALTPPSNYAQSLNNIDLTGDIVLSDKHSSGPLFQKEAAIQKTVPLAENSDEDSDNDFDTIRVKVKTNGVIKAYALRPHQRFFDLFRIISDDENVPISKIYLFDGDSRIHPEETPHSAKTSISTIYKCCIKETNDTDATSFKQTFKENQIGIKFQSDKWKKPILVRISKVDDFETAIKILCEQVPFQPNQVSLKFDGDIVNLSDTPMHLDFEGGEILDCAIRV